MINKNEIRVGNTIWSCAKEGSITVNENTFQLMKTDTGFYGIPLTPELLEECGFERIMNFASDTNWTYKMVTKTKIKLFYHCGTSSFMIGEPLASRTTVIYLHQLQNLYFALLGEELNNIIL